MRALIAMALLCAAPASAKTTMTINIDSLAEQVDHAEAWRAHLAAQRAVHIDRLRAYADAGTFPLNDETPGLLNIFVDEQGRRCAMANLIWLDGERALVSATARTHNGIRLGEVTDGPLMDWITTSGLTREEVAFVQEPDFFISQDLPVIDQEMLIAAEQARLSSHFSAAADQLELYSADSIAVALERLGDRIEQPPTGAVASAGWGWLR